MNTDKKSIIEIAKRKNKGKQILPNWLKVFNQISSLNINEEDLLSIENTEKMKAEAYKKIISKEGCNHCYFENDMNDLSSIFIDLSLDVKNIEVWLFSNVDQYIGAVKVPASIILIKYIDIWEHIGDDLLFVTKDLNSGFCLEQNYYNEKGEYISNGILELTSWGKFSICK